MLKNIKFFLCIIAFFSTINAAITTKTNDVFKNRIFKEETQQEELRSLRNAIHATTNDENEQLRLMKTNSPLETVRMLLKKDIQTLSPELQLIVNTDSSKSINILNALIASKTKSSNIIRNINSKTFEVETIKTIQNNIQTLQITPYAAQQAQLNIIKLKIALKNKESNETLDKLKSDLIYTLENFNNNSRNRATIKDTNTIFVIATIMSLNFDIPFEPLSFKKLMDWKIFTIAALIIAGAIIVPIYYAIADPETPNNEFNQSVALTNLSNLSECIEDPFDNNRFGLQKISESLQTCYEKLFNVSFSILDTNYWIRSNFLNTFLYVFIDLSYQIELLKNYMENVINIAINLKKSNPNFDDTNINKLNAELNALFIEINNSTKTLKDKRNGN